MEKIAIGIRYQVLRDPTTNSDESIDSKHWVLVFSGREVAFTIEAVAGSGGRPETLMEVNACSPSYDAFHLGSYFGRWLDLKRILHIHPQRGSLYSAYFNNSQHFVSLYLLFLNALAKSEAGKRFEIHNTERYARIMGTLEISGSNVRNKQNLAASTLSWATIDGGGVAAQAASVLAGANQAITVPAGGLPGLFGATRTFVGLTAGTYLQERNNWINKTTIQNPMIVGYPNESSRPAFQTEPTRLDALEAFISQSSSSTASTGEASAAIMERYSSNPGAFPADAGVLQPSGKWLK